MSGPLAMILVVMVIVIGIGSVWAITGQGASTAPVQDSFGNTQSPAVINQANTSGSLAVATMPIIYMAFIIAVCVVLVIAFVWLWRSGKSKPGKY
jgi:hypothetical protein